MRNLLLLFLTLALVACGNVKKKKENVKKDTEIAIHDEVVTRIVETIDTIIPIEKDSVSIIGNLDDLIGGQVLWTTNGKTTVKVSYDKGTGTVKAEGTSEKVEITVKKKRETTINQNTSTNIKSKEDTTTVDTHKDNTAIAVLIFKFCLLLILIILLAWWLYKKIF